MTEQNDECELGFWIGQLFWGAGLVPEAAEEVLRYAFDDLRMNAVWCASSEGNLQSKRVQEKLGFVFHYTCAGSPVSPLDNTQVAHVSVLTREQWAKRLAALNPCCLNIN